MDFGEGEFKIKVLNTGKIVKNMGDLVLEAGEFVWEVYGSITWSEDAVSIIANIRRNHFADFL